MVIYRVHLIFRFIGQYGITMKRVDRETLGQSPGALQYWGVREEPAQRLQPDKVGRVRRQKSLATGSWVMFCKEEGRPAG